MGNLSDQQHAYRHGFGEEEILHAITIVDLEPDADPPKVLANGADRSGNLLEIIWLELAGDVETVIHAMLLRAVFWDLLRPSEEELQ